MRPYDATIRGVAGVRSTRTRQPSGSSDRQSMTLALDLWSYDDVRAHADAIVTRIRNGSMPCDGAWPPAKIDVFARWVDTGTTA